MAGVAEKIKLPGESTTSPSFTSPQIQTAADVRQSQQVTGGMPAPTPPKAPVASPPTSQSTPSQPGGSTTSTVIPKVSPTVASPGVATVPTSTGAPPGVPQTAAPPPVTPPPPTVGLAPTLGSIQGHNAAEDAWLQANNQYNQDLYNAALAYNGGPTSALETNKKAAETGLRSATASRGAAGTIESSLFGQDKSHLATDLAVADQQAYNTYQQAITSANDALNKAQIAYTQANEQEKKEIAQAAEHRSELEKLNAPSVVPPAPTPPVVVGQTPQQASGSGSSNPHFPKVNPANGENYREYTDSKGRKIHEYEDSRKVVM